MIPAGFEVTDPEPLPDLATVSAALLWPFSVTLAYAGGLLLVAESVAVLFCPAVVGAYRTVMKHDFLGPRLFALQVSPVIVKVDEPASAITSALVAAPPELARRNCCDAVCPALRLPKL